MVKPKINIPMTKADWVLEIIGGIALVLLLIITATSYWSMPETIPTHFNVSGEVNDYGPKESIWLMFLPTLVVYIALTIFERYPHKFNYMLEITNENAERQYRNMLYMMRSIKMFIAILFLYLTYIIVQNAMGHHQGIGGWFLPIVLVGLLGTLVIFISRGYRLK